MCAICLRYLNYIFSVSDICSLSQDQGPCGDWVLRHYYDKSSGQCQYFYYGGCEGNENNFETAEECESRCSEHENTDEEVIGEGK